MKVQVLPYVTVEVDDRVRRRLRVAGERLRINLRAYLRRWVGNALTPPSAATTCDPRTPKMRRH